MKSLISSHKIHMLYNETARQRIFEVLFRYPDKEFSLSDLAKEARVKKSNIGEILDELHKSGYIEITKLSKIWRIKANQSDWRYKRSKIVHNLNLVYQSGLVDFLVDYYKNPRVIILFGSFRNGDDVTSSDIDIAVEMDEDCEYQVMGLRQLADFEKGVGRKVQIHLFNRKNIDLNVFTNVSNGIKLWGYLEVKP